MRHRLEGRPAPMGFSIRWRLLPGRSSVHRKWIRSPNSLSFEQRPTGNARSVETHLNGWGYIRGYLSAVSKLSQTLQELGSNSWVLSWAPSSFPKIKFGIAGNPLDMWGPSGSGDRQARRSEPTRNEPRVRVSGDLASPVFASIAPAAQPFAARRPHATHQPHSRSPHHADTRAPERPAALPTG